MEASIALGGDLSVGPAVRGRKRGIFWTHRALSASLRPVKHRQAATMEGERTVQQTPRRVRFGEASCDRIVASALGALAPRCFLPLFLHDGHKQRRLRR